MRGSGTSSTPTPVTKNGLKRISSSVLSSPMPGMRSSNIVIPTEEEVEVRSGQKRNVTKKILPGYILVRMKMDDQSWGLVRNTAGVTGFVSSGTTPVPLQKEEVKPYLETDGGEDSGG